MLRQHRCMNGRRTRLADTKIDPATTLLTTADVAALLRLPIKSIYELVEQRRIPVIRLGRRLRFDRSEVLAWIEKHRVPSLEDQ